MARIDLSRQAARFIEGLQGKRRRQVIGKVRALALDPTPPDSRPLRGYDLLRADIGEYQIVYEIAGDVIRVLVVGKRNDDDVYRVLARKR